MRLERWRLDKQLEALALRVVNVHVDEHVEEVFARTCPFWSVFGEDDCVELPLVIEQADATRWVARDFRAEYGELAVSAAWAHRHVDHMPARWAGRLLHRWRALLTAAGERAANLEFLSLLDRLRGSPVTLDASDADICFAADALTERAERMAMYCADVIAAGAFPLALARLAQKRSIALPKMRARIAPAVARMRCPQWWRRQLRRQHARAVEGSAIALGYVGKRADRYVSDESLRRRDQQNRRNARTLEMTEAENEDGYRLTLAELAARSTANKEIRRGELITRLKGFEAIALECGYTALFATITCPSKYHATADGAPNPKYSGATPADAQSYLARCWARIRAKLDRSQIPVYGFRIAEPHGDGCPHWHLILFVPSRAHMLALWSVLRAYGLREDGEEAGAAAHRVRCERIDAGKGTAVGYVIKYVAKNIDGFRVGDWRIDGDLVGDATLNLSPRIEAWAATWSIRQFAQIGGPPVGLWRELRRIPSERLIAAPAALRDAWLAAQRVEESDGEYFARCGDAHGVIESDEPPARIVCQRADFGAFTRACGGPVMRRADRPLSLAKRPQEGFTRYGEDKPARPMGVFAVAQRIRDFGGIVGPIAVGLWSCLVESVRKVWTVVAGSFAAARSAAPRTRVNNCTVSRPVINGPPLSVVSASPGKWGLGRFTPAPLPSREPPDPLASSVVESAW